MDPSIKDDEAEPFMTNEELEAALPGVAELEELQRPVSKIGDLWFGITADANQAVETMERMRKACDAFLRAYAEPVDLVALEPGAGFPIPGGHEEAMDKGLADPPTAEKMRAMGHTVDRANEAEPKPWVTGMDTTKPLDEHGRGCVE